MNIDQIVEKISILKRTAEELKQSACDLPCLDRNITRILASVNMLEINISDVMDSSDCLNIDPPD